MTLLGDSVSSSQAHIMCNFNLHVGPREASLHQLLVVLANQR